MRDISLLFKTNTKLGFSLSIYIPSCGLQIAIVMHTIPLKVLVAIIGACSRISLGHFKASIAATNFQQMVLCSLSSDWIGSFIFNISAMWTQHSYIYDDDIHVFYHLQHHSFHATCDSTKTCKRRSVAFHFCKSYYTLSTPTGYHTNFGINNQSTCIFNPVLGYWNVD